jgi:hypothetical protein
MISRRALAPGCFAVFLRREPDANAFRLIKSPRHATGIGFIDPPGREMRSVSERVVVIPTRGSLSDVLGFDDFEFVSRHLFSWAD